MEIKRSNPKLNLNFDENSQAGKKLAKEIILFADKNASAVSKSGFQEKLAKMGKLSTQDLIKFIRSFDKDESIIELIVDEVGSSKQERKDACKKVLSALLNKAKELGIKTKDFEQQFVKELDSQFNSWGLVNTEKLDKIINAITQSIENRQNLTSDDVQIIQNTSAEEGANQSNEILEGRLEKAFSAFGERVGEDGEMTDVEKVLINLETGEKTEVKYKDGQMQRDGIAADIADGFSKIWNNELYGNKKGNTADLVRRDLKAANAQLQQLKEAKQQGEEAYKAKFKEIFGIEYDYANILAYQKNEATYINASASYELEMAFNRNLKTLLSPAPLREEVKYDTPDPSTNIVITTVTATKEQVYNREFNNLAEFLTQKDSNGNEIKGSEILNKALEEKGITNGTIEEKFELLKQIAQALSKQLHSATLEAGGGKEFSEVQVMYDNSYKAAYGIENDIIKRVTDYNLSQEKGAAAVKAGTTIAVSLVATLTGVGLVGVASWTAGMTVAAEVIDRGSSGKAFNALKEDGFGAYVKTVNDDIDWEATLKQAVISGGSVLIGGAVAKGVSVVMEGAKPAAEAIAQFGGDVVCDASMEFLTTGKITVEGMVFTVLLSATGNIVAMKPTKTVYEGKGFTYRKNLCGKKCNIKLVDDQKAKVEFIIRNKKNANPNPTNLTNELERVFYTGYQVGQLLKNNPNLSRTVGSLPQSWGKQLGKNGLIQIDEMFYEFSKKCYATDEIYKSDIEHLKNKLSGLLGKAVNVEYIGAGQIGKALKITVDDQSLVLKIFKQDIDEHFKGAHGNYPELSAAVYASQNDPNRFASFYFGRFGDNNDGYMVTQFLEGDPKPVRDFSFQNKIHKMNSNDDQWSNYIGNKIIDYGAAETNLTSQFTSEEMKILRRLSAALDNNSKAEVLDIIKVYENNPSFDNPKKYIQYIINNESPKSVRRRTVDGRQESILGIEYFIERQEVLSLLGLDAIPDIKVYYRKYNPNKRYFSDKPELAKYYDLTPEQWYSLDVEHARY